MPEQALALKCQFCSAPMKLVGERRAACEHCGTELLLPEPKQQPVDLSVLTANSERAARAAERSAAELAIPRLERTIGEATAEIGKLNAEFEAESGERDKRIGLTWIFAVGFVAIFWFWLGWLGFVFFAVAAIGIAVLITNATQAKETKAQRAHFALTSSHEATLRDAKIRLQEARRVVNS